MQAANLFNTVEDWWDSNGALRSLHWINPARLQYVQQQICLHYKRDPQQANPYADLSILDIGCGGGLVCEPLARLGAIVTGIDLSENAIAAAQAHAATQNLVIDYRCMAAEALLLSSTPSQGVQKAKSQLNSRRLSAANHQYDVVLALDMLGHVAAPAVIINTMAQLVRPGGMVILSTINRSWQAWLGAIKLAENIFKFVPAGAHAYQQLIKPDELVDYCEAAGLTTHNLCGVVPRLGLGNINFVLSPHKLAVNYLLAAVKPA